MNYEEINRYKGLHSWNTRGFKNEHLPEKTFDLFLFDRWTIRARVTNKSSIRTWSNSRGDGKLFSMEIVDESVSVIVFSLIILCK